MSKLYIQTAKLGDIINLLPIAMSDAQSGKRSAMMTCAEYASIFQGVTYVDHIPFNGTMYELERAAKEARSLSDDIVVTQVLGDTQTLNNLGQVQRHTDSFAKEAWFLAGRLKDWQKSLPIIFDRRSPERELALMQSLNPQKQLSRQRKYILVAAGGSTSPFPYKQLLFELINGRFKNSGRFKSSIIDLDTIKAERFYDLLGLYERADCLIACDSAPLHLARACPNLPVCCLANDTPTYWHGSPWHKNHIFYCRYSDFPKRAVEMLDAIERIGKPASPFVTGVKGPKLIHTYSAYELNGEHEAAKATWEREYLTGRWIAAPIERGAIGRDSKTSLKDQKRYPFLKDVIRLAAMRAKDDDTIILTRDHTCFTENVTDRLNGEHPWYAHRRFREPETYHPSIDLFAFSKKWWMQHRQELPDMILGKDRHWDRVLATILKSHGGKEMTGAIYRKQSL